MRYITPIVALIALVSAQYLSDIPECALPCIDTARAGSTNCESDDYICICENKNTVASAGTSCVLRACGIQVATSQVLPAVSAFCDAVQSNASSSSSSSSMPATSTASTTSPLASSGLFSSSVGSVSSVTPSQTIISNRTSTSNVGTSSTATNTPTTVSSTGSTIVISSLAILALGIAATL
ncbi:uncharacterized protein F4822DRAFT_151617 [Hypoxylon trugodes]|uniref:uncharacterized protein n=1 Tax=Hypoxylon trugodes TaxID=326681 RepID=UPI00219B317A|nr:uncharacterized protein F4822DRAFT_151617 [Hypoxylon trugodes]KAI1390463.1 hypothetical protein F4822DRAFT_151617 [Hypoxylon trugodes]